MDTEYLRAEYQSLREEIMQTQARRAQDERYGAAAAVAVYAWLATEHAGTASSAQPFLWFGWWLPVLMAIFGMARARSHSRGIRRAGAYLVQVQESLDIGDLGWERHLRTLRAAGAPVSTVSGSSYYAWLGAIGLTVLIAATATAMICQSELCGPSVLNDLLGYEGPSR